MQGGKVGRGEALSAAGACRRLLHCGEQGSRGPVERHRAHRRRGAWRRRLELDGCDYRADHGIGLRADYVNARRARARRRAVRDVRAGAVVRDGDRLPAPRGRLAVRAEYAVPARAAGAASVPAQARMPYGGRMGRGGRRRGDGGRGISGHVTYGAVPHRDRPVLGLRAHAAISCRGGRGRGRGPELPRLPRRERDHQHVRVGVGCDMRAAQANRSGGADAGCRIPRMRYVDQPGARRRAVDRLVKVQRKRAGAQVQQRPRGERQQGRPRRVVYDVRGVRREQRS